VDENATSSARKLLPQRSSANIGTKLWEPLAPRPDISPDAFDDPVSDHFYKDTWLAAATYNVSPVVSRCSGSEESINIS